MVSLYLAHHNHQNYSSNFHANLYKRKHFNLTLFGSIIHHTIQGNGTILEHVTQHSLSLILNK
jgi:hypothetical protein